MTNLPERMSTKKSTVDAMWSEPRRASWDETWMEVAATIAKRSACTRRAAGAVIVSPTNQIISTGYNGPPASMEVPRTATAFNVTDKGIGTRSKTIFSPATCAKDCPRSQPGAMNATNDYSNCIALHAEENALLYAGKQTKGATIYMEPGVSCIHCAKLVAGAGITRVVARFDYERDAGRNDQTFRLWTMSGIQVMRWSDLQS